MLCRLSIKNVILVEQCDLMLHPGFNVITGETGSGKSVVLSAINLVLGEKASHELIRRGEEMGSVEALFSTEKFRENIDNETRQLLEEYSLEDLLESQEIILKRELFINGKSKAYINGTQIPLLLLKKLGSSLIEFSAQHAYMALQEEDFALSMIDSMEPKIKKLLEEFQKLLTEEKKKKEALRSLEKQQIHKEKEIERLKEDIEMIESSQILKTDTEALFHDFSSLKEKEGLFDTLSQAAIVLDGSSSKPSPLQSISQLLLFLQKSLGNQKKEESPLYHIIEHLTSAHAELIEAGFVLKQLISKNDFNHSELAHIESRLNQIEKIEQRWGREKQAVEAEFMELKKRIDFLLFLDEEIEKARAEWQAIDLELIERGNTLHEIRLKIAKKIQKRIEEELHDLNMPSSVFEIELDIAPRSITGSSSARLFLTPNRGEKRIEVMNGASGGEMARLFLATQTVSSSIQKVPTIIFDEVDANIGGVTAFHVGTKLKNIGAFRQVIAITHFPQVAEQADRHCTIRKIEEKGRTRTLIDTLDSISKRSDETSRMVGKELSKT